MRYRRKKSHPQACRSACVTTGGPGWGSASLSATTGSLLSVPLPTGGVVTRTQPLFPSRRLPVTPEGVNFTLSPQSTRASAVVGSFTPRHSWDRKQGTPRRHLGGVPAVPFTQLRSRQALSHYQSESRNSVLCLPNPGSPLLPRSCLVPSSPGVDVLLYRYSARYRQGEAGMILPPLLIVL